MHILYISYYIMYNYMHTYLEDMKLSHSVHGEELSCQRCENSFSIQCHSEGRYPKITLFWGGKFI